MLGDALLHPENSQTKVLRDALLHAEFQNLRAYKIIELEEFNWSNTKRKLLKKFNFFYVNV